MLHCWDEFVVLLLLVWTARTESIIERWLTIICTHQIKIAVCPIQSLIDSKHSRKTLIMTWSNLSSVETLLNRKLAYNRFIAQKIRWIAAFFNHQVSLFLSFLPQSLDDLLLPNESSTLYLLRCHQTEQKATRTTPKKVQCQIQSEAYQETASMWKYLFSQGHFMWCRETKDS